MGKTNLGTLHKPSKVHDCFKNISKEICNKACFQDLWKCGSKPDLCVLEEVSVVTKEKGCMGLSQACWGFCGFLVLLAPSWNK